MTFKDFKSNESAVVWTQITFALVLIACTSLWVVFAPVIDGLYDAKESVELSTEPETVFDKIYEQYGSSLLIVLIAVFLAVIVNAIRAQREGDNY